MFIPFALFYLLFTQIMSWAPGKLLEQYWHCWQNLIFMDE